MEEFIVRLHEETAWKEDFVACIGYFDGVHRGHQELIKEARKNAFEKGIKVAMISFHPDPWITLGIQQTVKHLTTMEDRKRLAETFGVDYWILLDFTAEMADLSPALFVEMLNQMPLKTLVCGYDFSYGKKGLGKVNTLEASKRNFDLLVVPPILDNGEKISTTRITKSLQEGDIKTVNTLLGYPFQISGQVIHGKQLGRKIGFPTANIGFSSEYLLPKNGVYTGKIKVHDEYYKAMINVGTNPTVTDDIMISLEVNILDFDAFIYEQAVIIEFWGHIRDEVRFSSIEELRDQLRLDQDYTRRFFAHD